FPAPLVLPGDELSWEPGETGHSFVSWFRELYRNVMTDQCPTVDVVPPPAVSDQIFGMESWSIPTVMIKDNNISRPKLEDTAEYLSALYHGLPIKVLHRPELRYKTWGVAKGRIHKFGGRNITLAYGTEAVRVRTRQSRDGIFSGQLDLNDLLDVAIRILPDDAYALLMVVDHDLWEDDNDEFCCDRAYGGSRVAVVSAAWYNPTLDIKQGVESHHVWPTSHCKAYIHACCAEVAGPKRKKAKARNRIN
ncbi:hypothetical protein M433DRAFT_539575, partial [Acidomyces richmondensis BFW]